MMSMFARRSALARRLAAVVAMLALFVAPVANAEDEVAASAPAAESGNLRTAEQLAQDAAGSVVVVTVAGRDGKQHGLGTGFVVSQDGLIATNLHVIGEARPISVEFADGKKFDVTEIHASDKKLDLAVVRIDADELTPLPLNGAETIRQGQAIVALGNPQGLRHSVVSGVVSGVRELDDRQMIQIAMPIEPGNSGGPVLDARGRVLGLVTMKSAVTENLGFAVPVAALKPLLEKPNPVPMSRWLTIGRLDTKQWTTLFGARWQQRAGRIFVEAPGDNFAGRSLCLSQQEVPDPPYEVAVSVKMDDEAGAAGLVFHADGGDKHYGFYPSAGKLRLTRFEGGNIYTWKVLYNEASEHYEPGDWNDLKVRVEKDRFVFYVNDEVVLETTDRALPAGKVGLAKFRDTQAEFKRFRLARRIPPAGIDPTLAETIQAQLADLPSIDDLRPGQFEPLTENAPASSTVLRNRADALERQAAQLRRLARDVHVQAAAEAIGRELRQAEDDIDLAKAALLVARLDDEELDVEAYLAHLDRMAEEVRDKLDDDAGEAEKLAALNQYLFRDNGFHGSRTDYYHRANSYLSRVIDDREGLPITLSLLYMELGRRMGLVLEGVGLPGHFVVRHVPAEGEPTLIDAYDAGKPLSRQDAEMKVMSITGESLRDEHLAATSSSDVVRRILTNLLGVAQRVGDKEAMLRYLEAIVAIDPESVSDRGMRSVMRFETGRRAAAIEDLDHILADPPEGLDVNRLREMRDYFIHGRR